jgi:membrane-bound lytic murein transglycosylase D
MVSANASAHQPIPKIEKKVAAAAPPVPKPVEQAAVNPPAHTKAQPIEIASVPAVEHPIKVAMDSATEDSIEATADSNAKILIQAAADFTADDSIEIVSAEDSDRLGNDLANQAFPVGSVVVPAPDPSDYAVSDDGLITVQANETLGHYADWLEIPTSRLRRLNGIRYGTPVGIGRSTKLDFSVASRETFEQRRLEYHHTLQEEFFDAYEVVGTDTHKLQKGDTLWDLAEKRYRVPVWLLRQYNPTLDFSALQAGTRLTVPLIAPRSG